MSLTDKTEKEKGVLRDIAFKLTDSIENPINNTDVKGNVGVNSYYADVSSPVKGKEYMREHCFDTVVDMRQELMNLWPEEGQMREFIPVVLAATFKNRKTTLDAAEELATGNNYIQQDEGGVLPTFIYNF
jgi:hypothetical protein